MPPYNRTSHPQRSQWMPEPANLEHCNFIELGIEIQHQTNYLLLWLSGNFQWTWTEHTSLSRLITVQVIKQHCNDTCSCHNQNLPCIYGTNNGEFLYILNLSSILCPLSGKQEAGQRLKLYRSVEEIGRERKKCMCTAKCFSHGSALQQSVSLLKWSKPDLSNLWPMGQDANSCWLNSKIPDKQATSVIIRLTGTQTAST